MGILSNIVSANSTLAEWQYLAHDHTYGVVPTMLGTVLTSPRMLSLDGSNTTWVCDVDINQTQRDPNTGDTVTAPLRSVPIAANNSQLNYAQPGQGVWLQYSASGQYQIIGFSFTKTGTYTRVPVCLERGDVGIPVEVGLTVVNIALGDLQLYGGGFGIIPLGASLLKRGATIVEIVY